MQDASRTRRMPSAVLPVLSGVLLTSLASMAGVVVSPAPAAPGLVAPAYATVGVSVTDIAMVRSVQLWEGDRRLAEATTPPYAFPVNRLTAGDHVFTARVTDSSGTVTSSAPVVWSVRPSEAPASLEATPSGSTARLRWATNSGDYVLESSGSLAKGEPWATIAGPYEARSGAAEFSPSASDPMRFYRLRSRNWVGLDVSDGSPGELITLPRLRLGSGSPMSYRFTAANGFSVDLPAVGPERDQVTLPMTLDPKTATPVEATLRVEAVFADGQRVPLQGGIRVRTPRLPVSQPGAVTLAFLQGSIDLLMTSRDALERRGLQVAVTSQIREAYRAHLQTLEALRDQVAGTLQGSNSPVLLKRVVTPSGGTRDVFLDTAVLAQCDRHYLQFVDGMRAARGLPPAGTPRVSAATAQDLATWESEDVRYWARDLSAGVRESADRFASGFGHLVQIVGVVAVVAGTAEVAVPVLATAAALNFTVTTLIPVATGLAAKFATADPTADPDTYPSIRDEIQWTLGRVVTEAMSHVEGHYFDSAIESEVGKGLAGMASLASGWKDSFARKVVSTVFSGGTPVRYFESPLSDTSNWIPIGPSGTTPALDDWDLNPISLDFGVVKAFGTAPGPQVIEVGPSKYPIEVSSNRDWILVEGQNGSGYRVSIPEIGWDGNWHGHVFFKQGKTISEWYDERGTRITATNWSIVKSVEVSLSATQRTLTGSLSGTIFRPANPTVPWDYDHLLTVTGTVDGSLSRDPVSGQERVDGFFRSNGFLWVTLNARYAGDGELLEGYGEENEVPLVGTAYYGDPEVKFKSFYSTPVVGTALGWARGAHPLPITIDYLGSLFLSDRLKLQVTIGMGN